MTVTASPPPITGSAAATTLPKTITSTIRAKGSAYVSALRKSLAETVSSAW